MKFVVSEIMERIIECPVCAGDMKDDPNSNIRRVCAFNGCGEFKLAAFDPNGDVMLEFTMNVTEPPVLPADTIVVQLPDGVSRPTESA